MNQSNEQPTNAIADPAVRIAPDTTITNSIIDSKPAQRKAEGMLLLTTLIWGTTFSITKHLLQGAMQPMGLLVWRFGIAAILFWVLYRPSVRRSPNVRVVRHGLILGALLYLGFGFQTIGLVFTTSSKSGFITALYVIFTPLFQIVLTRRRPSLHVVVGVVIVVVGLWGLTAPSGTVEGLFDPWRDGGLGVGDTLSLACAFVFAGYIVLLDRFANHGDDIISLTAIQLITATLLCSAHLAITEPWTVPGTVLEWMLILFLAVFATVATTYWQTRYQRDTTPTRAAVIFTMESVFGAIISTIVLHDVLGPIGIAGGALIVAGLLWTELGGKRTDC